MAFYTGSSADGRDMRPAEGMYVNPNNDNEWSSEPYPGEQKEFSKRYRKLVNHINGKRSIADEYVLITAKKSTLSKDMRDFVIGLIHQTDENI